MRHAAAEVALEEAGPHPDLDLVAVRFAQVQEPVRRPEEGDRATHDHVQQAVRIVVVEQRQGGLVEGAQVGVGEGPVRGAAPSVGLTWYSARSATATSSSLVRPSSGKQATPALTVTTGRESASSPAAASARERTTPPDPFGHLVGDEPVGAGQDRANSSPP